MWIYEVWYTCVYEKKCGNKNVYTWKNVEIKMCIREKMRRNWVKLRWMVTWKYGDWFYTDNSGID